MSETYEDVAAYLPPTREAAHVYELIERVMLLTDFELEDIQEAQGLPIRYSLEAVRAAAIAVFYLLPKENKS